MRFSLLLLRRVGTPRRAFLHLEEVFRPPYSSCLPPEVLIFGGIHANTARSPNPFTTGLKCCIFLWISPAIWLLWTIHFWAFGFRVTSLPLLSQVRLSPSFTFFLFSNPTLFSHPCRQRLASLMSIFVPPFSCSRLFTVAPVYSGANFDPVPVG